MNRTFSRAGRYDSTQAIGLSRTAMVGLQATRGLLTLPISPGRVRSDTVWL